MTSELWRSVRGILFDMDGVVHVGDTAIAGAAEAVAHVRDKEIPLRFLTNTTTKTPQSLCDFLNDLGIRVRVNEIFTTHQVAASYLRRNAAQRVRLIVRDDVRTLYKGLQLVDGDADFIVIGDIGNRWDYDLLNGMFNAVMDGAEMVALHKGRYWQTERGLQMDIGAFVCGLEYTTGKDALVIGKPSPTFFEMGVDALGVSKEHVVMIGDDIENDVGGAQRAGIRGVLVRTGKYRADRVKRSKVRPDAVLESIADLVRLV